MNDIREKPSRDCGGKPGAAGVYGLLQAYCGKLEQWPDIQRMFRQCFLNTLETTTETPGDGTTYVFTGDIPAMWLRDSSAQVSPYLCAAKGCPEIRGLIKGLVKRQCAYILHDPYANAFNKYPDGSGHKDRTPSSDSVWERKYETDSLCYPVWLAYSYYKETGDRAVFGGAFADAAVKILDTFETEQRHTEKSPYSFIREGEYARDTLPNGGKGDPVPYTGMTWSGFRPSDDRCAYNYLIPSNLFAVVVLRFMGEIFSDTRTDAADAVAVADTRPVPCSDARAVADTRPVPHSDTHTAAADTVSDRLGIARRALQLADEIEGGVRRFGIVNDPVYGPIYAYETDGLGRYLLMDDANVPSLLSLPYLGYCGADDEVYRNTRRFILSGDNPYFFGGAAARGVGSPHTPDGYIWHIGIIMQGLTAVTTDEKRRILDMLRKTHAGTFYMHEGFDANAPEKYTRPWFAWANSLFSVFIIRNIDCIGELA
jgi:meiotically up-regulated gene 157 (Mug157) protein